MTRHLTTLIAGFMAVLVTLVHITAAESQPKAGNDDAQLKAAQEERIKMLKDVEEVNETFYAAEKVSLVYLLACDEDLCNAQLDFYDEPAKRIAVLEKHLAWADEYVKFVDVKVKAGTCLGVDLSSAKAYYLDIKIKLLRERAKSKPKQGRTGS
jgi:CRISPR/Cas system-associated protein Csx1